MLRDQLRVAGVFRRFAVKSGGTNVVSSGGRPDPRVIAILRETGINASGIRATPLSRARLEAADHIWVMEQSHLDQLSMQFAELPTVPSLIDPGGESIEDPYFGSKADVRRCLERIQECVRLRANELLVGMD